MEVEKDLRGVKKKLRQIDSLLLLDRPLTTEEEVLFDSIVMHDSSD